MNTPALLEGESPLRYGAFLSYSHHDKAIAKRVQRQLETYRVPRRLVGRATAEGPVPPRLPPVFRDRDELHAGADLKSSVREALARSRWLVVVCTPDAARSPWVNREIIEFKRLRGERHVLALIAAGEPFASKLPGREAEECFPPALRRALDAEGQPEGEPLEPIAADMRRQGDGPQRAVLKLLAAMVGVGFDDLVRRDMQRRVRWLSALAAGSVLGVLVFGLMAVLAVQARNEAQHQRVQAEGLIEFMLGDLRKKLEPVGRLEVLDSVGEKALAYYGAQSADQLDATALGHRSRAMHLIGEIRDLRGNAAEAQAAFEQAAATTARLLAQAPGDGQRLFDHAQSVFWVGYAAWKRGNGRVAEGWLQEYLALALRLSKIDPANVDWRAEVAFAHVNLGTVQVGMGRPAEALQSLQLAGDLLTELVSKRPELSFELAQNHGWRADAYAQLGDYERALTEQQRRFALFRAMPNREKNKTAQRGMLSSLNDMSMYDLALGQTHEAEISAQASLKIAEALINEDVQNLLWRADACISRLRLVEIQLIQNRRADAQQEFAQASDCVEKFNKAGVFGLFDSMLMNARRLSWAALLVPAERRRALVVTIGQFLDQSTPKLTAETPDRAKLALELANLALAWGELETTYNDNAESARIAWRRAAVLLNPFTAYQNGALLTSLARARFYLDDVQGAQALVTRIQRSSYRHPAYAELVKQLQAARGGGKSLEILGARP